MGVRRQAREWALQKLFQHDFYSEGSPSDKMDLRVEDLSDQNILEFSEQLVGGVLRCQDEIDSVIEKHTEHWEPNRIGLVERNILRVAIYELLYLKETPAQVVMDEAIEIAKRFGAEDSAAFVNGILDHVHHQKTPTPAENKK